MNKKLVVTISVIIILGLIIGFLLARKDNNIVDNNLQQPEIVSGEISGEKEEANQNENYKYELLNINETSNGEVDYNEYFENLDYTRINRKDESKELVYIKNYEYIFQGSISEAIIPVINIESNDANEINKLIEESMVNYYSVDYEIKLNNDILTLIVEGDAEDSVGIDVYNINIYNGNTIKNEELLKTVKISNDELLSKLSNIVTEIFYTKKNITNKTALDDYEKDELNVALHLIENINELNLYVCEDTVNVIAYALPWTYGEVYLIQIK